MSKDEKKPDSTPIPLHPGTAAKRLPVIDSSKLFAGSHELWIEHNGEVYRLQRTKTGKLILTK